MRVPPPPGPNHHPWDDEAFERVYFPPPVQPPFIEVYESDPEPGLLGHDGEPLTERIPFGFQPPAPSADPGVPS